MPYIQRDKREKFTADLEFARLKLSKTGPGELNYFISSLVWLLFDEDPSYAKANELLGALEAVKQEFYRRKVAPYEDVKMAENGDVLVKVECSYCPDHFQAKQNENQEYFNSHHGY